MVQMAEANLKDMKRALHRAAYCEKEFGVATEKGKGYFVGVPCILGKGGMEKVVEIQMNADEKKLMDESISHVKDLVGVVRKIFPELA